MDGNQRFPVTARLLRLSVVVGLLALCIGLAVTPASVGSASAPAAIDPCSLLPPLADRLRVAPLDSWVASMFRASSGCLASHGREKLGSAEVNGMLDVNILVHASPAEAAEYRRQVLSGSLDGYPIFGVGGKCKPIPGYGDAAVDCVSNPFSAGYTKYSITFSRNCLSFTGEAVRGSSSKQWEQVLTDYAAKVDAELKKVPSCSAAAPVVPPTAIVATALSVKIGCATKKEEAGALYCTASASNKAANARIEYEWRLDGTVRPEFQGAEAQLKGVSDGSHTVAVVAKDVRDPKNVQASKPDSVQLDVVGTPAKPGSGAATPSPTGPVPVGAFGVSVSCFYSQSAGGVLCAAKTADEPAGAIVEYAWEYDGKARGEKGALLTEVDYGSVDARHAVKVTARDTKSGRAAQGSTEVLIGSITGQSINVTLSCAYNQSLGAMEAKAVVVSSPYGADMKYEWSLDEARLAATGTSISQVASKERTHKVEVWVTDPKNGTTGTNACYATPWENPVSGQAVALLLTGGSVAKPVDGAAAAAASVAGVVVLAVGLAAQGAGTPGAAGATGATGGATRGGEGAESRTPAAGVGPEGRSRGDGEGGPGEKGALPKPRGPSAGGPGPGGEEPRSEPLTPEERETRLKLVRANEALAKAEVRLANYWGLWEWLGWGAGKGADAGVDFLAGVSGGQGKVVKAAYTAGKNVGEGLGEAIAEGGNYTRHISNGVAKGAIDLAVGEIGDKLASATGGKLPLFEKRSVPMDPLANVGEMYRKYGMGRAKVDNLIAVAKSKGPGSFLVTERAKASGYEALQSVARGNQIDDPIKKWLFAGNDPPTDASQGKAPPRKNPGRT